MYRLTEDASRAKEIVCVARVILASVFKVYSQSIASEAYSRWRGHTYVCKPAYATMSCDSRNARKVQPAWLLQKSTAM